MGSGVVEEPIGRQPDCRFWRRPDFLELFNLADTMVLVPASRTDVNDPMTKAKPTLTNLERFKSDLTSLIRSGNDLGLAIQNECFPEAVLTQLIEAFGGAEAKERLAKVPRFDEAYQIWYSEAKALIRQLLPDRLGDFVSHSLVSGKVLYGNR